MVFYAIVVPDDCPLTPRQYEAVVRVMRGASYAQVALDMGVELSTVRTFLHEAYGRLGAGNARQAYTVMLRHGWFARRELPGGYEGKPFTTLPNWGVWTWLPTPGQRLYLDAFDRFLRDRDEYRHSRAGGCRHIVYFEREIPAPPRIANDFDGMIAKIAPAICTRPQLDVLRAARVLEPVR